MRVRVDKDMVGGAALIVAGVFAAAYALMFLRLGTVENMGPGMFPMALGILLTALGGFILVPSLARGERIPGIDVRPFVAVLGAVLTFALMVRPFGLVPAIVAMTLVASRADGKLSPLGTIALAAGLSAIAVLIFRVGLGVQVATIAWPW